MNGLLVSTTLQARLLLDLSNAPLLALLMEGERSAGSLARELSQDVRRVHYRLGRLYAAGLIRVSRVEKRAGRAVKHYEAPWSSYRVPFTLTDAATLRELVASLYAPFLDSVLDGVASTLADRDAQVLTLSLDEGGTLRLGFDTPLSGASFTSWGVVELTPRRAAEVRARLMEVFDDIRAAPEEEGAEGARRYLVGLLLTPGDLPG